MNCKLLLLILIATTSGLCQSKSRPYECGFVPKGIKELRENFDNSSVFFGCKSGEHVASVGAGNGSVEAQISVFVDGIFWILQDIDTKCLNKVELSKVLSYHKILKGDSVKGSFSIVVGDERQTSLESEEFDRIIMSNVYHEVSNKQEIMTDVRRALKPNGHLVIMEAVAKKKGQKRGDCKHEMIWKEDFLRDMSHYGFRLLSIDQRDKRFHSFFTFVKQT